MRLADALRIPSKRFVAFTGAGGKSTAIGRITRELSEEGHIILTSTTKLHHDQSSLAHSHIIARKPDDLSSLRSMLEDSPSVLVTGDKAEGEPKWVGVDASTLDALHDLTQEIGGILLIEADGARGRSLKAPADHEPVVPHFVDLVVPVVGLDVIGASIDEERVHRPERAALLLGTTEGEAILPEHVFKLLTHPSGGMKDVPDHAEVRVLLNKAETQERLEHGRAIANLLLTVSRVRVAVIGSVSADQPVHEVFGRLAGVVLAAGDSKRLGQPKQLILWRGKPLVMHAVEAGLGANLFPIAVVIGAGGDAVRKALEDEPVMIVENEAWSTGLSTSVRVGLASVESNAEAVVMLLSDMPFVQAELVEALIHEHRRTLSPLVVPRSGGRRTNPVLFDRSTFDALRAIRGDQGGRSLLEQFPKIWVECEETTLFDLDTPEDLQRLKELE
ncbi:MAG: putative selenium-dependent hydroxylase accessory protein YqeC [Anaerolineaceae bacterium]|nr:MAG: putative selenium-dependent hydroxylase accessory protein YqeC [Anaerolineaceae bacterium]